MFRKWLSSLAILVLLVAACAPAATPTPTRQPPTPTATATPLRPGVTPPPATPSPTPTPTKAPEVRAKYGGVLRYPLRSDPVAWDGQASSAGIHDTRVQYNTVYETLFTREAPEPELCKQGLYPDLAESWKWVDDLTLEVKVRQGVRFHKKPPVDGREVTAADFVFGLKRGFFTWPIRGSMAQAKPVVDIVAMDRYTLRVINKEPNPGLVEGGLGSKYGAVPLPAELGNPKDKWEDPYKYWVGTGPFQFVRWDPAVKMVYEKHPDYWRQGLPYLDRLEFLVMPEHSTREAAIRTGRLDLWNMELHPTSAKALSGITEIVIQKCPAPSGYGMIYMRHDRPPLNDVRVRRAFSMAIDRDAILDTILEGQGYIAGFFRPTHPLYLTREQFPPEVRKYLEYHPEEAKKLLAEAGYPKGLTITISTSTRYGITYTSTLEAIADTAAKAGFTVRLKFLEHATFMATVAARKWAEDEDASLFPSGRGGENVWADVFSWHTKAAPTENRSFVSDPEYDPLAEAFLVTVDKAKAEQILRQLQIRGVDQVLNLEMPSVAGFSAHRSWVKNYAFSGEVYWGSAMFGKIWLDR